MDVHELRKKIDGLIFEVEVRQKGEMLNQDHVRTIAIVRTKLQEAKMWAGKILELVSKPLPKENREKTIEDK